MHIVAEMAKVEKIDADVSILGQKSPVVYPLSSSYIEKANCVCLSEGLPTLVT